MMASPNSKKRKLTDITRSSEWRLYPPQNRTLALFQNGDAVTVKARNGKSYRAGTIIASIDGTESHTITVEMDNERKEIFNMRQQKRRILPIFRRGNPAVIVTPETNFFRQMAVSMTNENDRVLEIGCSTGETSRLLIPLCHSWVGLDTSPQMIAECKETIKDCSNLEHSHLEQVDALVDRNKAMQASRKFCEPTAVYIDIGGNREHINVLRITAWVLETFSKATLVVIKSRELARSMKQTKPNEETGLLENGSAWFESQKRKPKLVKHPLKAPMAFSPQDASLPICRYHNYHKNGCQKHELCPLDHEHCHACQEPGHIAKVCPKLLM